MRAHARPVAAAPSESYDALLAVVVPPGNTGLSAASFSAVVSGRGPSSRSSVTSRPSHANGL
jgi:hypothetical protein